MDNEIAVSFEECCCCTCVVIRGEEKTTRIPFQAPWVIDERDDGEGCTLAIAGRSFNLPMTASAFFARYEGYRDAQMAEHSAARMDMKPPKPVKYL